jgi:hypothetical protein
MIQVLSSLVSLGYTLVLNSLISLGYTGYDVQKLCNMIDYKLYITPPPPSLNYDMIKLK